MNDKADILRMLEQQLEYHKTEALKIKNAIIAYTGGVGRTTTATTTIQPQRLVRWTSEIEAIFESKDKLTADDIKKILTKKGIEQANSAKGRSAIVTTLGRMKSADRLISEDGIHYLKI